MSYDNGVVCGYDAATRVSRALMPGSNMLFALQSNSNLPAPAHLKVLAAAGDGGRVQLLFSPTFASAACVACLPA